MLGRLFSQSSFGSQGLGGSGSGQNMVSGGSNLNSYDDAYTREILYGTTNANQISPSQLSTQLFRIVVCQDGGNLRNKQVLFDSSQDQRLVGQKPQSYSMTPKQGHNINELNDYMFGCGLPSSESHSSIKLHVLPTLNSMIYGSYESVLITRLFSIYDESPSPDKGSDWDPRSTLPVKNKASIHSNETVSSRFSIGLVITLESIDEFHDVIFNNWDEISQFLIILQRLTIKKMITHLNSNPSYVSNKRIQFPPHFFQADADFHGQLVRLIKLVHYNSNIPKLINSNVLMYTNTETKKFQSVMFSWILEILNWLEFKDGKSFNPFPLHTHSNNISPSLSTDSSGSFLASLFALLIPMRSSLSQKPVRSPTKRFKRDITRVVVMTGNPTVAKKLIFIINGLIPDSELSSNLKEYDDEPDQSRPFVLADEFEGSDDDFSLDSPLYSPPPVEPRIISQSKTTTTTPIPIQRPELSTSYGSSDNSLARSTPSMKGWEIPQKSGPSTKATSGKSRINVTTQNIPIENRGESRGSVSKSSSMAQLSSSLNSSLSSSLSSYSLSKLGGSFMEKWKNSFNSNSNAGTLSNYPENVDHSQMHSYGSLSKRQSMQSLRTPSPACEADEFTFLQQGSVGSSVSTRVTRSHSMVDLFNKGNLEHKSLDLKRSKTSLIVPLTNDNSLKNVAEHNRAVIKAKCSAIMKKKVSVTPVSEGSLNVQPINFDFMNAESPFKQKSSGSAIYKCKPLLPAVAFTDEFRPEFILQSCPTGPKVESQILNAMRNDLIMNQNFLDGEHVASKTVFINLRAREIKCIHMHVTPEKKRRGSTNTAFSHAGSSPEESNARVSGAGSNMSYSTNIKKVYTPSKNVGDKQYIGYIESVFEEICNIVIKKSAGAHSEDFEEKLSSLVSNLFK